MDAVLKWLWGMSLLILGIPCYCLATLLGVIGVSFWYGLKNCHEEIASLFGEKKKRWWQ